MLCRVLKLHKGEIGYFGISGYLLSFGNNKNI